MLRARASRRGQRVRHVLLDPRAPRQQRRRTLQPDPARRGGRRRRAALPSQPFDGPLEEGHTEAPRAAGQARRHGRLCDATGGGAERGDGTLHRSATRARTRRRGVRLARRGVQRALLGPPAALLADGAARGQGLRGDASRPRVQRRASGQGHGARQRRPLCSRPAAPARGVGALAGVRGQRGGVAARGRAGDMAHLLRHLHAQRYGARTQGRATHMYIRLRAPAPAHLFAAVRHALRAPLTSISLLRPPPLTPSL